MRKYNRGFSYSKRVLHCLPGYMWQIDEHPYSVHLLDNRLQKNWLFFIFTIYSDLIRLEQLLALLCSHLSKGRQSAKSTIVNITIIVFRPIISPKTGTDTKERWIQSVCLLEIISWSSLHVFAFCNIFRWDMKLSHETWFYNFTTLWLYNLCWCRYPWMVTKFLLYRKILCVMYYEVETWPMIHSVVLFGQNTLIYPN